MGDIRLILRFRDFNYDVGTIDAHNEIIRKRGSVLWGWWKKDHEPQRADELFALNDDLPVSVLILNRETGRAYKTTCEAIFTKATGRREVLVPAYYRSVSSEISRWFEFREVIQETEYDAELAKSMGEQTLIIEGWDDDESLAPFVTVHALDKPSDLPPLETRQDPKNLTRKTATNGKKVPKLNSQTPTLRIVHISDLHFASDDHNFDFPGESGLETALVTMAQAVARDFHDRFGPVNAHALVISGDITSRAGWEPDFTSNVVSEIEKLAASLGVQKENILLAPGNHDFERPQLGKAYKTSEVKIKRAMRFKHETEFRVFRYLLLGTPIIDPLSSCYVWAYGDFDVKVGVLNSANLAATDFVEYGFVGDHLDGVLEEMSVGDRPAFKVLVLHHHLVPIAYIEEAGDRAVSVTLDAHLILNKAQRHGVQVVLHGHQHIPKIIKTAQALEDDTGEGLEGQDIYIVASGSAGSRHLPEGCVNTYSIFEFSSDGVRVECRKLDRHGNPGRRQFEVDLDISPRAASEVTKTD